MQPDLAPVPLENEDVRFREMLEAGTFAVQHCDACGKHQFPPGPACWRCGALAPSWVKLEGAIRGSVYTYTIVRRSFLEFKDQVPYTVVVADLAEYPELRVLARYEGDGEKIKIGDAVTLAVTRNAAGEATYGWSSAASA